MIDDCWVLERRAKGGDVLRVRMLVVCLNRVQSRDCHTIPVILEGSEIAVSSGPGINRKPFLKSCSLQKFGRCGWVSICIKCINTVLCLIDALVQTFARRISA